MRGFFFFFFMIEKKVIRSMCEFREDEIEFLEKMEAKINSL